MNRKTAKQISKKAAELADPRGKLNHAAGTFSWSKFSYRWWKNKLKKEYYMNKVY